MCRLEEKNIRWDAVEKINRKKSKIKFPMEGSLSQKGLVCCTYLKMISCVLSDYYVMCYPYKRFSVH